MRIRAFITHKKAEKFADCQDRFGVNLGTKSLAVSDGMGSTWQQKIWAQILVDQFTQHPDWKPRHETIKPLCLKWRNQVIAFIQSLKDSNAPENMIFRNERSLADGRSAGATFVGIRFDGENWNGCVLGDSCLVEWNGENAVFHTSQDVEEFDSYPDYFDSDATKEGKGIPKDISGTITNGCLLLVSDPFSDFLLEHKKQGDIAEYINQMLNLSSHEDFEALVAAWRNAGMHNDDTTLVIVEDDNNEGLTISHLDDIDALKELESRRANELSATPTKLEDTSEGTQTKLEDASVSGHIPPQSPSPNEDEKDFITELREWLDQSLKKVVGKKKANSFLKRFFSSSICNILQQYKITKK